MVLADVVVLFLTVISAGSLRYFFEIRRICGGHRRGEQRDVLVLRGVGEDRLDVLGEAHVEHLVGLVEHEEAQLGEVERALLEVVHDPAGRADDDVDAAAQRGELHAVPLAAVDRQHVHARAGARRTSRTPRRPGARARGSGASTSACGVFCVRSRRDRIGSANAAVLPVPVWARPTTSRPSSSGGMVAAWIGGGRLVADVAQRLQHRVVEAEVGEGGGVCSTLGSPGWCSSLVMAHDGSGSAPPGRDSSGAETPLTFGADRAHSTVTDFARLRGLSMSWPRCSAAW